MTVTQSAADAIRAALNALAPTWVETPTLQPAGLYLELVGEDIRARAFAFPGADGAEWCLRPDMTAPVVRDAIAAGLKGAVALAYDGLVFRRQARDSARETEFRVVGAEILAPRSASPAEEAALMARVIEAARACGVEPAVRIGDIAVARAIVAAVGLAPVWRARIERAFARTGAAASALGEAEHAAADAQASAFGEALAALPPERASAAVEALLARGGVALIGRRSAADIAARMRHKAEMAKADRPNPEQIARIRTALAIADAPDAAFSALAAAIPTLGAPLAAAQSRWSALTKTLDKPVAATFSAGFGRGPTYYDGLVFELEAPHLGARASLGGGGRYDGLLAHLATRAGVACDGWSAMGFSLRPQRLADAGGAA